MRYFFYYYFLSRILGNPIIALIILVSLFMIVERKFIGIMPDIFKPLKRKRKISNLISNIKLNPANINAYRELGYLYLEQKKYKKAVENLQKTLDKMDDYAETHFLLGKAYYLQGDKDRGVEELEKGIKINPKVGYGEPYVYLLSNAYRKKELEQVSDYISNLHYFGTVESLYKAGKVLLAFNESEAREMFKRAWEIYRGGPKYLKKTNRRWALLAKMNVK